MKQQTIYSEGSERLLLIFAGWGMDIKVVRHLRRPGYDTAIVYDYTSLDFDPSLYSGYKEICLMAWSMGVWAASTVMYTLNDRLTLRIAVNGTERGVDDNYGIPETIFDGTLSNLSDLSIKKFFRRMSASISDRELFASVQPERDLESLRGELSAIRSHISLPPTQGSKWDIAIVGSADHIFPPSNQLRFWKEKGVKIEEREEGHFFDFSLITDKYIIDKEKARRHFEARMTSYEENATVQHRTIDRLIHLIAANGMAPMIGECEGRIIEIGSGPGYLSRIITTMAPKARISFWDVAAPAPEFINDSDRFDFLSCDAEIEVSRLQPASISHIFTASTVQWFNSPERFLANCHNALKPGGCLFLTTYTAGNMYEITDLTGRTLPLLTSEEWEKLAERDFKIVAKEADLVEMKFNSPVDVLSHLRATGVNSLGFGTKNNGIFSLLRNYPRNKDGSYTLTYKPLILLLFREGTTEDTKATPQRK